MSSKSINFNRIASAFALLAMLAATPLAQAEEGDKFDRDRESILALAGDFAITFQFDETMTLDPEFEPSEHYESKAMEAVRVIEDRGDFISLQHILLAGEEGEEPHVVKHWRQDWQFEDDLIFEFQGKDEWAPRELSKKERRGTWSQSVFQVDDSPRYEGFGTWVHEPTQSYWQSNDTPRPLPRRESKRSDEYDMLTGTNRHVITSIGWIHQQDNTKVVLEDGNRKARARETGLNTYARVDDYDFAPALDYWENTKEFWSQVRDAWSETFAKGEAFRIDDGGGAPLWRDIFSLAKRYEKGDFASKDEVAEAIAKRMDNKVVLAAN